MQNVISLETIWQTLWSRRLLIGMTTGIGLLISIGVALLSGPSYTVSMILVPSVSDTENSSLFGQLPSLLGGGESQPVSKFRQFKSTLFATGTAELMDQKYGALCDIDRRCDPVTRKWRPRPAWRRTVSDFFRTAVGMPPKPQDPQISDLVTYINNNVTTVDDKSILTLIMTDSDPEHAKAFLKQLVDSTNANIKAKDSVSLDQYVTYLSDRIAHLDSIIQREPLTTLLMTEERRLMLTHVGVPYAATPLDGPVAQPRSPALKFEIGIVAGFVLGCMLALGQAFGWFRRAASDHPNRSFRSNPAAYP